MSNTRSYDFRWSLSLFDNNYSGQHWPISLTYTTMNVGYYIFCKADQYLCFLIGVLFVINCQCSVFTESDIAGQL